MHYKTLFTLAMCLSQVNCLGVDESELDQEIQKIRTGTLVIEAPANTEVRVEQLRHEFWFGAALANQIFRSGDDSEDAKKYKEVFLANFNSAVTENALKWHVMERRKGRVDYSVVDSILEWTDRNDIPLRGHNIFWGIPNRVPDWQKSLDDAELKKVVKAHALDIGRRYRGRFAEYDLNNEMMHANYYEDRFGPRITREMAMWVREEDPKAVLYLNDYDILTGKRLEDFVVHVRKLRELGVPFDGLGVQGHLHGDSFDPDALQHALNTLAEFGLPIRITEFNFPGQRSKYYGKRGVRMSPAEEQAQASALAQYFRVCFAHPAVEGILLWGFWEGANWIPVSSLFRRDWSATPAAEAYRKLVFNRWWTRWQGRTDLRGQCEVRAFYGKHRVSAGSQVTVVELKQAEGIARVSFSSP